MIKQPDVLMFLMLYGSEFTQEQLAANYDFYEPRCIHESSLSPSIHSILACRLGRMQKAEDYFGFATRMDLDDYNRNTCEGLHTTSINKRVDEHCLRLRRPELRRRPAEPVPCIPAQWKQYSFTIQTGGSVLRVTVSQERSRWSVSPARR